MIERLGEFAIIKKLGAGGMGEVYLARQQHLDRLVALKVLPMHLTQNPDFVARFEREAKSAASLIHTNVIQIYTFGQESGFTYFAMEYVDGEDLGQKIKRKERFTVEECLRVTTEVAKALAAAEEMGVVHRDIKPSNVMIGKKGEVKVMDFGLAKLASSSDGLTQTGIVLGTVNYMSPEQAQGLQLDSRSDQYSLGVLLYELLTGQIPFRAESSSAVIYKHIHEQPPRPRDLNGKIPVSLERIVLTMMAKSPGERYPKASDLVTVLSSFRSSMDYAGVSTEMTPAFVEKGSIEKKTEDTLKLGGSPPSRGKTDHLATIAEAVTPATVAPPAAKSRAGVMAGVAAAVAVIGIGGYWMWSRNSAPVKTETKMEQPVPIPPKDEPPAREKPIASGEPSSEKKEPPVETPVPATAKKTVWDLSPLNAVLPAGTLVIVDGNVQGKTSPSFRKQIDLNEGDHELELSRDGYTPRKLVITLAVGKAPDMTGVRLDPTLELVENYTSGETLLKVSKFAEAETAFEKVMKLDDNFRNVQKKLKSAREGKDAGIRDEEARKTAQGTCDRAKAKFAEGKWEEAKVLLDSVADKLPEAKLLQDQIASREREMAKNLADARDEVKRGDYLRARNRLEDARKLRKDDPQIPAIEKDVALAESYDKRIKDALGQRNWAAAETLLPDLEKLSPDKIRDLQAKIDDGKLKELAMKKSQPATGPEKTSEPSPRQLMAEKTSERPNPVARIAPAPEPPKDVYPEAFAAYKNGDYAAAAAACAENLKNKPDHEDSKKLKDNCEIRLAIIDFDKAFAARDPEAALRCLACGDAAALAREKARLERFRASSVTVRKSRHGVAEGGLVRNDTPGMVLVYADWELEIGVGDEVRAIPAFKVRFDFVREKDGWKIAKCERVEEKKGSGEMKREGK